MQRMYQNIKRSIKGKYMDLRISLSADNNPLFTGYYKYLFFPKKNTLNDFLNQYSLSQPDFTVIQVGANDGITHDPIHKFIKRDQWRGVFLEPQPDIYKKYLHRIYQNSQGIKTIFAAIGHEDGYQTLYKIGFCDMRWATGLASFNLHNLKKAFKKGYVKANCNKHNITMPADPEAQITTKEIRIISPKTLMKGQQINKINLLQIDTEGYDYEVIKLFNIEKSQPKVIIYENEHLTTEQKKLCTQILTEN